MPCIDYVALVKIFHITSNNARILDQNGTSSNSLRDIPSLSQSRRNNWPWNYIWISEFIGGQQWLVGVNELCCQFSIDSQSKGSHCRVLISRFIDGSPGFDSGFFAKERRRGVLSHVKVPSVDYCIDHVLFCIIIALPCSAYSMGVFGKYPRASPMVSLTTNSKLESFMLNFAYPPVSLVLKGEAFVRRVKMEMEGGRPKLRSSGLIHGY